MHKSCPTHYIPVLTSEGVYVHKLKFKQTGICFTCFEPGELASENKLETASKKMVCLAKGVPADE